MLCTCSLYLNWQWSEKASQDKRRIEELKAVISEAEKHTPKDAEDSVDESPVPASSTPEDLKEDINALPLVPSSDLKELGDEAYEAGLFNRALDYYNTAVAFCRFDHLVQYAELYEARARTHAR